MSILDQLFIVIILLLAASIWFETWSKDHIEIYIYNIFLGKKNAIMYEFIYIDNYS